MAFAFRPVFLLLLLPALLWASAQHLQGSIDADGTARVQIVLELNQSAPYPMTLNVSGQLGGLQVQDRQGRPVPFLAETSGNMTIVQFTVPADYVQLQFQTDDFTYKDGDDWLFGATWRFSPRTNTSDAAIRLPPNAELRSTNGLAQADGDGLLLTWSDARLQPGEKYRLQAIYRIRNTDRPEGDIWGAVAYGLVLVAAVSITWMASQPKRSGPLPPARAPKSGAASKARAQRRRGPRAEAHSLAGLEANPLFQTLEETDKDILREIFVQKGRTTQAHLYLYTHLPKATLSRHLRSLENRGLVVRSQKGNRKLVSVGELLTEKN